LFEKISFIFYNLSWRIIKHVLILAIYSSYLLYSNHILFLFIFLLQIFRTIHHKNVDSFLTSWKWYSTYDLRIICSNSTILPTPSHKTSKNKIYLFSSIRHIVTDICLWFSSTDNTWIWYMQLCIDKKYRT
jgi:Na+/melibiose symporter-like transporter